MTSLRRGPNGRLGMSPERRQPASQDGLGAASAVDQRNLIDCTGAGGGA